MSSARARRNGPASCLAPSCSPGTTARRGSGNFLAANNVPVEGTKRFRGPFETKTTGIYHHRPEAAAPTAGPAGPPKARRGGRALARRMIESA